MTYRPSGREFHEICQQHAVPDYVKTATIEDLQWSDPDLDTIASFAADPLHHKYPCHTKAATWVSASRFSQEADHYPERYRQHVLQQLVKHACLFGIEQDIQRIFQEDTQHVKVANAMPQELETYYLFPDAHAGRLGTPEEVKNCIHWLLEKRDALPLAECSRLASRIAKRANALNVEVPDSLERLLGFGISSPQTIVDALVKRSSQGYRRNPEGSRQLLQLAENIRKSGILPGSKVLFKVACAMDNFDHDSNLILSRRQGRIPRPEDVCYRHTVPELQKVAANHMQLINGDVFAHEDVSKISRADFEAEFGEDLASEIYTGIKYRSENARNVLPTLPRPIADALSAFFGSHGVPPVRREKAAQAIHITDFIAD